MAEKETVGNKHRYWKTFRDCTVNRSTAIHWAKCIRSYTRQNANLDNGTCCGCPSSALTTNNNQHANKIIQGDRRVTGVITAAQNQWRNCECDKLATQIFKSLFTVCVMTADTTTEDPDEAQWFLLARYEIDGATYVISWTATLDDISNIKSNSNPQSGITYLRHARRPRELLQQQGKWLKQFSETLNRWFWLKLWTKKGLTISSEVYGTLLHRFHRID
jgi:hypothetical protein